MSRHKRLADALDSLLVMPRGNSIQDKQLIDNLERLTYQCTFDGCDFEPAMQAIKNSEELKMLKMDQTIVRSVEIISQNQEQFIPQSVLGFRFESPYVNGVLSNTSVGKPKSPETRIGLFSFEAIHKMFQQHDAKQSDMTRSTVFVCISMSLIAGFWFWAHKKSQH
jgi:hypothetical protein